MVKKEFLVMDYNELDDLICKTYGVNDFESIASEEWNNYSRYEFGIKKSVLTGYDLKTIENVRAGKNPSYAVRDLLTDMCNNDIIPEGDYLIVVSW